MTTRQSLAETAAEFGIPEDYYFDGRQSTHMSFDSSVDDIGVFSTNFLGILKWVRSKKNLDNFASSPSPPERRFAHNSNYYDPGLYEDDDDIIQFEAQQMQYDDRRYSTQTQQMYQSPRMQQIPVSYTHSGYNHQEPITAGRLDVSRTAQRLISSVAPQYLPINTRTTDMHPYQSQHPSFSQPQASQPISRYQPPVPTAQFSQQPPEPACMRGSNPRNTHGTRLRPVSELRWCPLVTSHTMHHMSLFLQPICIEGCSNSESSMPSSPLAMIQCVCSSSPDCYLYLKSIRHCIRMRIWKVPLASLPSLSNTYLYFR
jgi:hypothetical protein